MNGLIAGAIGGRNRIGRMNRGGAVGGVKVV
jgi:hypothetical protein